MFGIGFDKKTIIIVIVALVVLKVLSAGTGGLLDLLLIIPGVLIALTFHEFAHAYVAYKLGDETPKLQGRLNLNPISHLDPIGTIFLLTAGFGWGKPVQIDSRNFNGKHSISKAEAIVAAAGPITNFILAFLIFTIMVLVFNVTNIVESMSDKVSVILYIIFQNAILINIGLGVFNLLPIPPLDGSKILMHFLPYNAKQWFYNNEQFFYIIFLLFWITGISSYVIGPMVGWMFNGMGWIISSIFGLFM